MGRVGELLLLTIQLTMSFPLPPNHHPAGGVFADMGHALRLPVPAEVPCTGGLCTAVRPTELVTARATDAV